MGNGRNRILFGAVLLLVAAGALLFRLPQLDMRPMHGDEANQAEKTGILLEKGEYRYDPREHHGPTLYYFALAPLILDGVSRFADSEEWHFRIVPVVFGVALILLLWFVRDGLGRDATLCAAVFTAISPAMVYYSRYYIQEMLLVFFTFAAIAFGWRYLKVLMPPPNLFGGAPEEALGTTVPRETAPPNKFGGGMAWAILIGVALGLMHATKETAILAWAAMGGALVLKALLYRRQGVPGIRTRDFLAALIAAAAVSMLFFSSFFTHPRGIPDSVLTYTSYVNRAGGAGLHDHPWYFYLSLFAYTKRPFGPRWSEGLILGLAVVGSIAAFVSPGRADKRFLQFLVFYTLFLTVIYALIPYKTPWSALSFFHGMILLAGVGATALVRWARLLPLRIAVALILALGAWQLGNQAYRATYDYPADYRNPYAYAHPTSNVIRLAERMELLAAASPQDHHLTVKVMAPGGDYWPLPWYLRKFDRVGYWDSVPPDPDADIVITTRALQPELEPKLKQPYHADYFGLRADVILQVYTRQDLWDSFMETRQ